MIRRAHSAHLRVLFCPSLPKFYIDSSTPWWAALLLIATHNNHVNKGFRHQ
jgi:hypothetical protein